jgi:hypothetical protein
MSYHSVAPVVFPAPSDLRVNMMPILAGDPESIPDYLRGYIPLIDTATFTPGEVIYLTVHESAVLPGISQRRGGIHTEGTNMLCWGGGGWGGGSPAPSEPKKPAKPAPKAIYEAGVFMASTDGRCRVWDCISHDVNEHGELASPPHAHSEDMAPNTLYWLTDRTPHEALPSLSAGYRQFYRLVGSRVGGWWEQHSTPNPLGVTPTCKILTGSKFRG